MYRYSPRNYTSEQQIIHPSLTWCGFPIHNLYKAFFFFGRIIAVKVSVLRTTTNSFLSFYRGKKVLKHCKNAGEFCTLYNEFCLGLVSPFILPPHTGEKSWFILHASSTHLVSMKKLLQTVNVHLGAPSDRMQGKLTKHWFITTASQRRQKCENSVSRVWNKNLNCQGTERTTSCFPQWHKLK